VEKVASYSESRGNRKVRLEEACMLHTMGKAAKVLRHLLKEGVRATAGKPGKRDGLKIASRLVGFVDNTQLML